MQKTLFQTVNGSVTVNNFRGRPTKPPLESKGNPKQARFYPDMEDAIDRAIRAERVDYTAFATKCSEVGITFNFDQIDTLLKNKDVLSIILSDKNIIKLLRLTLQKNF